MDLTPIIVATIMAIPGIILFFSQARKDRIDTARMAMEMAEKLDKKVKELEDEISELRKTNKAKDERIEEQDGCIVKLESRVDELETENQVLRTRLDAVEKSRRTKQTGGKDA